LVLGGLRLVLVKKRTFCNRAYVQIALKPLGFGLVLQCGYRLSYKVQYRIMRY